MNIRDLQDRLVAIVPDVRLPEGGSVDDLYPFRFTSTAFVPPFMDALMRVMLAVDDDGAEARLTALTGLLEQAFLEGDDEIVDALAMRLVHTRLCARPEALTAAWPYLGEQSRRVAWKFLRLAEECDQREAAIQDLSRK